MKIRDVMRPGVFTIAETDCLGNAYRAMNRSHIRHLPVTNAGALVGMLSERDILAARAHADETEWWSIPVRLAMQSPVHTANPDDSLTEIAGRMAMTKIGALPVVERGKLRGIVTVTDVLDAEVRSAMAPGPVSQATAAETMTAYPQTVRPDAALADAVAVMVDRHVRHLPVVDATSQIVGMLSECDVRSAVGDPALYLRDRSDSPAQYRVGDVMSRPAVTIPFDTPIGELAHRFADDRIGALPIVDRFGALIGIVSYVDALRVLAA
jgi:acetoin utilization protein AcuB